MDVIFGTRYIQEYAYTSSNAPQNQNKLKDLHIFCSVFLLLLLTEKKMIIPKPSLNIWFHKRLKLCFLGFCPSHLNMLQSLTVHKHGCYLLATAGNWFSKGFKQEMKLRFSLIVSRLQTNHPQPSQVFLSVQACSLISFLKLAME